MRQVPRALGWVLGAAILLLAGGMLWRQLQSLSFEQLQAAWAATPAAAIAASVVCTAISFACLAGYELFATRQLMPGRIPRAVAFRVGALSHGISNTLGFHALTATAVRFRAYRDFGLSALDVARLVAVVGACVGVGVVAVSVTALLWMQVARGGIVLAVLLATLALLVFIALRHRIERSGSLRMSIPLRNAGWLSLLGLVEMLAAIGALYVLLPPAATPAFAAFVIVFITATLLGIISHAPGGVGVFEASVLAATPAGNHAQVLVALLAYRAIYNLLPFALAMGVLLFEFLRQPTPGAGASV